MKCIVCQIELPEYRATNRSSYFQCIKNDHTTFIQLDPYDKRIEKYQVNLKFSDYLIIGKYGHNQKTEIYHKIRYSQANKKLIHESEPLPWDENLPNIIQKLYNIRAFL
jgi:hypothetical protein